MNDSPADRNDEVRRDDMTPREVESLLASLKPVAPRIDRDRLMFLAGQAAVGTTSPVSQSSMKSWFLPTMNLLSTSAAIVLAVLLVNRPERISVVERERPEKETAPTIVVTSSDRPFDVSYLRERNRLLAGGFESSVASTTDSSAADEPALDRRVMQESLLRELGESL